MNDDTFHWCPTRTSKFVYEIDQRKGGGLICRMLDFQHLMSSECGTIAVLSRDSTRMEITKKVNILLHFLQFYVYSLLEIRMLCMLDLENKFQSTIPGACIFIGRT